MLQKIDDWVLDHKQVGLIVLLVVLIGLVGLGIYKSVVDSRLKIVSTFPKTSSIPFLIPALSIDFNQNLSNSNLELTSSPNIITGYSINGSVLEIKFSELKQGDSYKINIVSLESASNKLLKNKSISFVARNIPYSDLSKAEQQEIVNGQDNSQNPDQGLSLLPHLTVDYQLLGGFIQGTNKPDIEFNYTPTVADTNEGQAAYNSALSAAEAWLSQNNLSSYPLVNYSSGATIN